MMLKTPVLLLAIAPLIFAQNVLSKNISDDAFSIAVEAESFNAAEKRAIPLSDDEIRAFRLRALGAGLSSNNMPVPKREAGTHYLEEGGPSGMVGQMVVYPGYSSTIAFVDQMGNPFPVVWHHSGNSESIKIEDRQSFISGGLKNNTAGLSGLSNVLIIDPQQNYVSTNGVVHLQGLSVPITIDFVSSLKLGGEPHYDNPTFVVPVLLKQDLNGMVSSIPMVRDTNMLRILDKTAVNAVAQGDLWHETTTGDNLSALGEVYTLKDKPDIVYFRTRLQLIEPQAIATVAGAGVRVYRLPVTSTLVTRNARGKLFVFIK